MFLDKTANQWKVVPRCKGEVNDIPEGYVLCCSNHLSMFALMEVTQSFDPIPENSYLTNLVIYNLIALGLYLSAVAIEKACAPKETKSKEADV